MYKPHFLKSGPFLSPQTTIKKFTQCQCGHWSRIEGAKLD